MHRKLLISTLFILINIYTSAQSNNKNFSIDSTKIEILGNSVYRMHIGYFNEYGIKWMGADSTSIHFSKISIGNVLFKKSKPEILAGSLNELDNLSTLLINNPKILLRINGHADKIGNKKSNLKLSIVRAKMIKLYLTKKGVKPNRISTTGFGDSHIICHSPCEKNQRVEFLLSVSGPINKTNLR